MTEELTTRYNFLRVFPHDEPGGKCPACSQPLTEHLDDGEFTTWFCNNDQCPFRLSDAVQNVVQALLDLGHNRREACEIALAYTLEDDAPEPVERFSVKDRSSAEWVMRKLAETEAEISEIQDSIEMEVARAAVRIRTRGEQILTPLRRRHQFFTLGYAKQLQDWARTQITDKKRSVKLIHGSVKFTRKPERVQVTDPEKALQWAKELDLEDLIKSTESFKTQEFLKDWADKVPANPALQEFAEVVPESETVKISPALPGGDES